MPVLACKNAGCDTRIISNVEELHVFNIGSRTQFRHIRGLLYGLTHYDQLGLQGALRIGCEKPITYIPCVARARQSGNNHSKTAMLILTPQNEQPMVNMQSLYYRVSARFIRDGFTYVEAHGGLFKQLRVSCSIQALYPQTHRLEEHTVLLSNEKRRRISIFIIVFWMIPTVPVDSMKVSQGGFSQPKRNKAKSITRDMHHASRHQRRILATILQGREMGSCVVSVLRSAAEGRWARREKHEGAHQWT